MGLFSKLFGRKQNTAKYSDHEIQSIVAKAERDTKLINKSLRIANNSTTLSTKLSRISTAKVKLEELKDLASQYPFIELTQLDEVEVSITELEHEIALSNPISIIKDNTLGEIIEKQGQAELVHNHDPPRKIELGELSKEIGSTTQSCPYCETPLIKFPQRKTKCKSCSKFIYARKEPLSGQKRLFREDELALYDEIKELSMGSWDWWHENQKKITKAKEELAGEWNVEPSSITDGDAKWRINASETMQAFANRQWPDYIRLREEAIRQLNSENKKEHALRLIPETIYLTYAAPNELDLSGLAEYSLMENEKKTSAPLASLYLSVAGDLDSIDLSFRTFSKESDLPKMFEASTKEAWVKFKNDFNEYLSLLKN